MGKVQSDIKTQMSTRGSLTAPAWNPEPVGQPIGAAIVTNRQTIGHQNNVEKKNGKHI